MSKEINPSLPWEDIAGHGMFDDMPRRKVFELLGSREKISVLDVLLMENMKAGDKMSILQDTFRYGFGGGMPYELTNTAYNMGSVVQVGLMAYTLQVLVNAQR